MSPILCSYPNIVDFFVQILQEKKNISHNPTPPKVIIQILHPYKIQIFNGLQLNKHCDSCVNPLVEKIKLNGSRDRQPRDLHDCATWHDCIGHVVDNHVTRKNL